MSLAGRLGAIVLGPAGCGEERRTQLAELPYDPQEDMSARRERGEWVLEGPHESLRFLIGDLERDPWAPPVTESVPLADAKADRRCARP